MFSYSLIPASDWRVTSTDRSHPEFGRIAPLDTRPTRAQGPVCFFPDVPNLSQQRTRRVVGRALLRRLVLDGLHEPREEKGVKALA